MIKKCKHCKNLEDLERDSEAISSFPTYSTNLNQIPTNNLQKVTCQNSFIKITV